MIAPFRYLRNAFVVIAFGAIVAACGGAGGGGGTPTPTTPPAGQSAPPGPDIVPAAGTVYLGAYVNNLDVTPPPVTELTTLESQIGRTVAITQHYYGFFDQFPGAVEVADAAAGRLAVESWSCQYPNSAVAAGNEDTAIRKTADAFKAFGKPIFLRYMWEMNLGSTPKFRAVCYDPGTDEPNGVFSPSEYIAAWDHIRAIFTQEGVTNVIWLWNPAGTVNPLAYYPGAGEVDWIGVDKYDDASVSFQQTYSRPYSWLGPLGKPIMIAETGAAAPIQPAFFASAAGTLQSSYPNVKAFVYFDSAGFVNDWTFDTNGLAAFTTMANQPFFSAREF